MQRLVHRLIAPSIPPDPSDQSCLAECLQVLPVQRARFRFGCALPSSRCDVEAAKAPRRADANRLTSAVIALYTLTSAAHAGEPDVDQPTAAWAAAHYRDFQRITPTPVLADPALLVLCTTLTPA